MRLLRRRGLRVLAALAAVMASAQVAAAQEEEQVAPEGPQAPIPSNGEELGSGDVDGDLQLYWGGRRALRPVVERRHVKEGRFEAAVFGGIVPNDAFLNYVPVGLRLDYHFTESLALEVAGSYLLGSDTELNTFLQDQRSRLDPLLDLQEWRGNVAVAWSPFYGKLALLQRKLSHFDINLVAGGGVVSTVAPEGAVGESGGGIKPEGMLGMGFRLFMSRSVAVRLDYRQYLFPKSDQGVALPSEFTLGVSWLSGE
jgi:outer membrane beta-barrel protein